jgi:hypothetical protein
MALLSAYKEILCSPKFFYLGLAGNLGTEEDASFKLAERLAFFLWCSVPDEPLLKAAAEGSLIRQPELESQVKRMLKDEKSRRWVERFADQWLQTSQLGNVAVDRNYYPKFKDTIKELMHRETYEAVNDVFRNGASALDLLKADHVFVNQTLAGFYKLRGVRGEEFQKVAVDEKSHRGGLLGHGSILTATSNGVETQPVVRGIWVLNNLLGTPPNPPPPDIDPIEPDTRGVATIRQLMEKHRNNPTCYECHRKIDPIGLSLENYDYVGAWRDRYSNQLAIDSSGKLPDGTTIPGPAGIKTFLLGQPEQFTQCLTKKLFVYALGRRLSFTDRDDIDQIVSTMPKHNYGFRDLVQKIVASEAFHIK